MRTILTLAIAIVFAVSAQAETLMGSDRQSYSSQIKLRSATMRGDRYATVTGRVSMNGTMGGPLKLLSDVNGLPAWIDNLEDAEQIQQRSPTDRDVYMRFSAPAGFEDRDSLMRFVARRAGPGVVVLDMVDVAAFPEQPGVVRMKDVRGRFRFEQVKDGALAVEFRLHYDSSATPVSLANLSVNRQVKQTLVRMRQLIEGPLRNVSGQGPLARQLGI